MRGIILFAFLLISATVINAQSGTCEPDPMYADSTFGVYPAPYDDDTMTGGIDVSACINKPFEVTLTAIVPAEVEIAPGAPGIEINSITVADGGVSGLPEGFTYACNPPNCIFEAESQGCVTVYGTATDANVPGEYNLTLQLIASTTILGDVPLDFPGPVFPGRYFVVVNEENSTECTVASTENLLGTEVSFEAAPNPFGDYTQIEVNAATSQKIAFQVHDLLGNQLYQETINLAQGANTIDFDGSDLANGMYIYSISNNDAIISKRMIVSK